MRALVQRVREADVTVDSAIVGAIGRGMLVLAGVTESDDATDREWLARKIVQLRIFDDEAGVMNRSVVESGGEILAVSQFTLYASTRKGNRPSYIAALASVPDSVRGTVLGLNGASASVGWVGAAALGALMISTVGFEGFGPLGAVLGIVGALGALACRRPQNSI